MDGNQHQGKRRTETQRKISWIAVVIVGLPVCLSFGLGYVWARMRGPELSEEYLRELPRKDLGKLGRILERILREKKRIPQAIPEQVHKNELVTTSNQPKEGDLRFLGTVMAHMDAVDTALPEPIWQPTASTQIHSCIFRLTDDGEATTQATTYMSQ